MSKELEHVYEQTIQVPKNVQQIGNIDNVIKVYLEDYNGTYIRRLLGSDTPSHGILIGKKQSDGKKTVVFVRGILQVDVIPKEQYWKYDWNKIYELIQKYFLEDGEQTEILGWAMSVEDRNQMDIITLEKMHRNNFEGNMSIALILDRQEMHEQFYIYENNQFHSLGGYYVYYDKNKAMHNYVMENQPGPCVETEEIVRSNTMSCRTILQNRREMMQRKQTASLLYVASSFLVMIVIVLGVTMMNNYDKMQQMQITLGELSESFINEESETDYGQSAYNKTQKISYDNSAYTDLVYEVEKKQAVEGENVVEKESDAEENTVEKESDAEENTVEKENDVEEKTGEQESVIEQENAVEKNNESQNEVVQAMSGNVSACETVSAKASPEASRLKYRIQPGDTLENISLKMYNTVQMVDEICKYNNIEDVNQIVAGDVLILP